MSINRVFAIISGVFFLFVGIGGLVPSLFVSPDVAQVNAPLYWIDTHLFHWVQVNGLMSICSLILGVGGLWMSRRAVEATRFAQLLTILFALLTLLGFFSATQNLFGVLRLGWSNAYVSVMIAQVAAVFGFVIPPQATVDPQPIGEMDHGVTPSPIFV